MINIRKRNNLYEYRFEVGKVNGKRKQISKSGFKTKSDNVSWMVLVIIWKKI